MLTPTHASDPHSSTMSQSEPSSKVLEWLCMLHLDQYAEVFQNAGLATIQECLNLTQDQLDQMGIKLPGHQKRILTNLSKMQDKHDAQSEKSEVKCHTEGAQRERPEKLEGDQKNEERQRPTPRQRAKPVPKERLVSRQREKRKEEGETMPSSRKRSPAPTERKEGERNSEAHKGRDKPIPKQRTKFLADALVDCPPYDPPLPPVPPRITLNCPPQCFTSSPSPPSRHPNSQRAELCPVLPPPLPCRSPPSSSRPASTPASTPAPVPDPQHQTPPPRPLSDGTNKAAPISSASSPPEDEHLPPLPPKVGAGAKGPPPIPKRLPVTSPSSSPPATKTGAEELTQRDQTPQVPPRTRTQQTQEDSQQSTQADAQPPQPPGTTLQLQRLSSSDDNSDDYEDPDLFYFSPDPKNNMSLSVPGQRKERSNSLFSDDGLLSEESDPSADLSPSRLSFHLDHASRLSTVIKEDSSQFSSVIKMGWLEKNVPQGVIYQKRWVKLDADYLRYFDSNKDIYSKGLISTAFISCVGSVGEQKFEVVTNSRTFTFKADGEAERNEWVAALQESTRGRQRQSCISQGPQTPDYQGYLELKGLRSKLYTVVASDKVFLYKNFDDYRIGVGITSIDMNVGNIKESDRRSFDLTTPYRIFSFAAESEQTREQWIDAMRNAISEALSNKEVVERIWEEPSNSFCADCSSPKPDWAAVNLCVVICKRCAGEHRGLGPSISKVRSLKMDKKVWTEELVQVFLKLGNERVNSFWAANVPPSEALTPHSSSEDRRRFITNKYRQGKYRKYHPLYGNQRELNNALCINVRCSDLLETLSLIFCGADVNCSTGVTDCPTPESLAIESSQLLQAELIKHNLNTELPQLHVDGGMDLEHYQPSPCASYNGFLFKTASMARAVTERKGREEFSRRWCTLNDGTFSYYETDRNSNPNGVLKVSEIVCLAVDPPEKHGYEHTFELYSESERIYLFGTDDPETYREWVKSIAKSLIPPSAEPLLRLNFSRIGRLKCKDGLNLQSSKLGWFALEGFTLHVYLDGSKGEEVHLRKVNELSIRQDNEVLVLVEKGRTLYIEGERKLDFAAWCGAIQAAGGSGGDTLSQQQLTEMDIPIIVHSCIDYITQCGLTSEGIYRKSGVNSRVAGLCDRFRQDARSLRLKEGDNQVDDVSNTLKRFFRDLEEGLFTEDARSWLSVAAIQDESEKIAEYKILLNRLPPVNKATLQALINHLYCVQCFADLNQMNIHNLAIVFGPTLFQTDGQDYTAGRAIEDLIEHYTLIFEVDEQQLNKQLEEIRAIIKMRNFNFSPRHRTEHDGHFICTVYLEEIKEAAEQHVKVPGSMSAAELTYEVLDRRNIPVKKKDYWSCWEVCEKEEMERLLHYQDRVLPILHCIGTESHLVIKKYPSMEAMIHFLASKVDVSKHGMMKFREERSILGLGLSTGNFHDRYFVLNVTSLRMYKDVRSNRPDRDWPVKNLKIYLGIKKKPRSPTCWGLTVVYESKKQEKPERQQWYLCCETQSELREWYATFLSIQNDGDLWPQDGLQQSRVSRVLPDTRHGNVSLIPLRGSENEMRNSVAAFSQDPLAVSQIHQSLGTIEGDNLRGSVRSRRLIRDIHAEQLFRDVR